MWMAFLGVYVAGVASSIFIPKIYTLAIYNRIKKKGYDTIDKKKSLKQIKKDLEIGVTFFDFLPFFNNIFSVVDICMCSSDFKEDLQKVEYTLIDKKLIKKSDEVLKEEADTLIKQDKFEKAKEQLGDGKLGSYANMNHIEKLSFINGMENSLESDHSENKIFNELTLDEKKEFLTELRREILGNTIEEKQPKKKMKKR